MFDGEMGTIGMGFGSGGGGESFSYGPWSVGYRWAGFNTGSIRLNSAWTLGSINEGSSILARCSSLNS